MEALGLYKTLLLSVYPSRCAAAAAVPKQIFGALPLKIFRPYSLAR